MLISPSFSFPERHPRPSRALTRGAGKRCILSYHSTRSTHVPRAAAPRRWSRQLPKEPSQPSSWQARGRADADAPTATPAALEEPLPLLGMAVIKIKPSCLSRLAAGGPPSPNSHCPEPKTAVSY